MSYGEIDKGKLKLGEGYTGTLCTLSLQPSCNYSKINSLLKKCLVQKKTSWTAAWTISWMRKETSIVGHVTYNIKKPRISWRRDS